MVLENFNYFFRHLGFVPPKLQTVRALMSRVRLISILKLNGFNVIKTGARNVYAKLKAP